MERIYAVGAGLVVLVHFSFVLFVAAGALLSLKWRRAMWVHLPAVVWAAYIEFSGGICPLTPLENDFRAKAGLNYYSGDFVARYLFPVLYPEGLTRQAQMVIGLVVLAANLGLYIFVYTRRRRFRVGGKP
jgi:uncharacterized protein DUF2784